MQLVPLVRNDGFLGLGTISITCDHFAKGPKIRYVFIGLYLRGALPELNSGVCAADFGLAVGTAMRIERAADVLRPMLSAQS